ncbi:hypothetical protein Snoj_61230 [Streptomyces nojiriensis]|uniref:Uncharacterized protein n=1 Tax=Streptomyces nojiriensis TaxID=66374 RepID=A0ABQ3SVN3_9ACTN|nr:hypothetical protein [Streptomyces nojiriensis]QTI45735.1 hypothetical protein JYK04_03537 [Streptomyces nojiriensis]GGS33697.1 hypothetical protein GCM10010205_74820 [Streptomyces nojiriensis]GHI72205.1 hypothetical protein Snoj_61230 [Streptomyces nojiriensis]
MADDNGASQVAAALTLGLAGPMGALAGAAYGAANAALRVEFDSLSEYKRMVDGLLDELTGSDADHKKLADGKLPASKLGKGFTEVDALFKSYDTVVTQLQNLSKGLAGTIEALGIAVLSAGNNYAGVDEETKRRMAAIAKEAKAAYVEERDPWPEEQRRLKEANQPPTSTTPTPTPSTSTAGGSYS